MKITLLSGGSGNEALLRALMEAFPKSDIKVILNAYDNGKSTGVCRAVTGTLGVSDIRKNHERMYRILNGEDKKDPIIKLYQGRPNLGGTNKTDLMNSALEVLRSYGLEEDFEKTCEMCIKGFFSMVKDENKLDWHSFNLVNMIYSYYYAVYGYEATNKVFTDFIGIPDFVLLNSFDNAFVHATTRNGVDLTEGDIVEWCNKDDPIISLYYVDSGFNKIENPTLNARAIERIYDSDIIIQSTGTFWSSLYPTFQYGKMWEVINKSRAKKIWYVNTIEDKDSWGYGINWFLRMYETLGVKTYQWDLVMNTQAQSSLRPNEIPNAEIKSVSYFDLGNENGKNDYHSIKSSIIDVLFGSRNLVFDWDDTIRSRNDAENKDINERLEALNKVAVNASVEINSGNNLEHITKWRSQLPNVKYFVGCGEILDAHRDQMLTSAGIIIPSEYIKTITSAADKYRDHYELYTPTCLKYKRFYDAATRDEAWRFFSNLINSRDLPLVALKTGVGSIDIVHKNNIKLAQLTDYIYFSDLLDGPDAAIAARAKAAYKIDSVAEMASILNDLIEQRRERFVVGDIQISRTPALSFIDTSFNKR